MEEKLRVAGDTFRIKHRGNFKTRPDLTWHILYVSDTQSIITIPFEYGENTIIELLSTRYFFNHMKSVEDKLYYVIAENFPDEVMISELKKL